MRRKSINKNSLMNLEKRVLISSENAAFAQAKGAESKRKRGLLRNAVLDKLYESEQYIDSSDILLLDSNGNEIKVQFNKAIVKSPNYEAIANIIIKEATLGKEWAIKIIIEMDENYKNRQLEMQNKTEKKQENLLLHIQKLSVMPNIKDGDDEIPDYDSLGRTPE